MRDIMEHVASSVAWISIAAVLIAFLFTATSCQKNADLLYKQRQDACVAAGGSFVPATGRVDSSMCLMGKID